MEKLKALIAIHTFQFKVFTYFFVGVFTAVAILNFSKPFIFQRFLGAINPLFAFLLSGVLGYLFLSFLLLKKWGFIYRKKNVKALLSSFGLVLLFVCIAILVDLKIIYPADTHLLFPESILFYPAMAFLVEIIFHLVPLSLLLFLGTSLFRKTNAEIIFWNCIVITSLLEPTYQVFFMKGFPMWAAIVVWLNVFFFNLTQLVIFKKYDFISMYLLRIFYYLVWHILWGYFRLDILF